MNKELQTAMKAADAASRIALKYWRKKNHVRTKTNWRDPVTIADVKADRAIRKMIKNKFPDHGIVSEELDDVEATKQSEYVWVIDPIDGTMNYAMGLPTFSIAIGLLKNSKPVLGVIDHPALSERYWAEAGNNTLMKRGNKKPVRCTVSKTTSLKESKFSFGFSYTDASRKRFLKSFPGLVMKTAASRIHYCAAYDCTNVARGGLDFYISINLQLWDFVAAWPIVEGSGGEIVNLEGKPITIEDRSIVATNKKVTHSVLKMLK
ncbi:MAG: inositol monophosphatase [Candidatus Kerfeldbacteria bacterium]